MHKYYPMCSNIVGCMTTGSKNNRNLIAAVVLVIVIAIAAILLYGYFANSINCGSNFNGTSIANNEQCFYNAYKSHKNAEFGGGAYSASGGHTTIVSLYNDTIEINESQVGEGGDYQTIFYCNYVNESYGSYGFNGLSFSSCTVTGNNIFTPANDTNVFVSVYG